MHEPTAEEKALLLKALEQVQPLPPAGRVKHQASLPPPIPVQRQRDEAQVLKDAVSDVFDADYLLDVDESLSFRRPGIGLEVLRKLRRGKWVVGAQLDLHGFRVHEAREHMALFIHDCIKRHIRCIRIIHGKGLGSKNRTPILKGKVRSWLIQKDEVMAFVEARPQDGGSGALIVLLKLTSP